MHFKDAGACGINYHTHQTHLLSSHVISLLFLACQTFLCFFHIILTQLLLMGNSPKEMN